MIGNLIGFGEKIRFLVIKKCTLSGALVVGIGRSMGVLIIASK